MPRVDSNPAIGPGEHSKPGDCGKRGKAQGQYMSPCPFKEILLLLRASLAYFPTCTRFLHIMPLVKNTYECSDVREGSLRNALSRILQCVLVIFTSLICP